MYTDHPIERCTDDAFGHADFARMIGDILISTKLGESFCIGLMGPWGSGKTSIINMVDEYVSAEARKPNISIGDSLKAESSNGLFTRAASGEAMHLANELLIHLNAEDMFSVLEEMISRLCESNINITSFVLNKVYIAHGKLLDGEEKRINRDYPELSSDDHLTLLEKKHLAKVKEIRDKMDAFLMMDKSWFMYFYKRFPEGKDFLIRTITSESDKIIYYLYKTSTLMHRIGKKATEEIEITGKYRDLVTDGQIKQAIQDCMDHNRLPDLSKD